MRFCPAERSVSALSPPSRLSALRSSSPNRTSLIARRNHESSVRRRDRGKTTSSRDRADNPSRAAERRMRAACRGGGGRFKPGDGGPRRMVQLLGGVRPLSAERGPRRRRLHSLASFPPSYRCGEFERRYLLSKCFAALACVCCTLLRGSWEHRSIVSHCSFGQASARERAESPPRFRSVH